MHALCLISGDHEAQLDHLASLASLLTLPLFVTDLNIYDKALKFYPFTKTHLMEESSLLDLLASCDLVFVSCKHFSKQLAATLNFFFKKSPRFCYCPHGNSDKGWSVTNDLLQDQDLSLVYGRSMLNMLKKKNVLSSLNGTFTTGNYRLLYYRKHQDFYDSLAQRDIFSKFSSSRLNVFYAPTWKDGESNSSFFKLKSFITEDFPAHLNLIIKLHPTLEKDETAAVYNFLATCDNNPQIHIIKNFPPIYPILNKVDALLSDVSSVGYDYLYFDRPIYLIPPSSLDNNQLKTLKLTSCSKIINPQQLSCFLLDLDKNISKDQQAFEKKRKKLYAQTFDNSLSKETFAPTLLAYMKEKLYEF